MSRERVSGDGISMLGRPAVRSSRSSRSLIIDVGRLLSVIHLTRWALEDVLDILVRTERKGYGYAPDFWVSMSTMGIMNRLLALVSKEGKDRGTWFNPGLATNRIIDSLFTEASDRMVLEIGCRRSIHRVLEAAHSTSSGLTFEGSTGKEVA